MNVINSFIPFRNIKKVLGKKKNDSDSQTGLVSWLRLEESNSPDNSVNVDCSTFSCVLMDSFIRWR